MNKIKFKESPKYSGNMVGSLWIHSDTKEVYILGKVCGLNTQFLLVNLSTGIIYSSLVNSPERVFSEFGHKFTRLFDNNPITIIPE